MAYMISPRPQRDHHENKTIDQVTAIFIFPKTWLGRAAWAIWLCICIAVLAMAYAIGAGRGVPVLFAVLMGILTFPAGFMVTGLFILVQAAGAYLGIELDEPFAALAVSWGIFVVVGHWQWLVLIPAANRWFENRLQRLSPTFDTRGSVRILSARGIPLFVHWSFPLGGLILSAFVQFRFPDTVYLCLAYAALIALHEFAHAAAARSFRVKVFSVSISGVGGLCSFEMPPRLGPALVIYSAGLLAQAGLLVLTIAWIMWRGDPQTSLGFSFAVTFTLVNAFLLLVNLVPSKPRRANLGTDGYMIWKLVSDKLRGRPFGYPDTSATFERETRLLHLGRFTPAGFVTGIEILNDNTTPMQLVIDVLERHLSVSREKAVELMLATHMNGGVLIPVDTYERAVSAAAAISEDAVARGHPLVCRPVDARKQAP